MKENYNQKNKVTPKELIKNFREDFANDKLFFQLLDEFPYLIVIFTSDGKLIYINKVGCDNYNVAKPEEVLGKYNVLEDKHLNIELKRKKFFERAFKGEILTIHGVKVPHIDVHNHYTRKKDIVDEIKSQVLTFFPIFHENGQIAYIVVSAHITGNYKRKKEIVKAQEYMHEHWLEDFDINKLSEAIELSSSYFTRLFKQYTEMSPYEYYKRIKINKLKEHLHNSNTNITEAFHACGLNYKSNYGRFFKEIVGMTPSEYKKKQPK